MSESTPNRWDYDSDEYYYDEDSDMLISYKEGGDNYRGDGEKVSD